MALFRIFFKASIKKELRSIPKNDLEKILLKIGSPAEHPRPQGSEKLTGLERYRLRQGKYRIVYSIQDDILTVWVVKVGQRKDVYR